MRRSDQAMILLATGVVLVGLSLADAARRSGQAADRLDAGTRLVAELGLTDLALFTEARYTRHLSQADLHSAFQDHPMALEHFPSGSLVLPPAHLRGTP